MAQNGAYRNIGGKTYVLKPRSYVAVIPHTGVASATASVSTQIDPSSPFLLTDIHVSDSADPSVAAPGLVGAYTNFINIQDQANNYNWMNAFIPRAALARDPTTGYRFKDEVLIDANTRLNVSTQEPTSGNTAGTTYVTFQGYSLARKVEDEQAAGCDAGSFWL